MAGEELMRPHTSAHEDQGRPKKECVDRWIIVKLLPLVDRSTLMMGSPTGNVAGKVHQKRLPKIFPTRV